MHEVVWWAFVLGGGLGGFTRSLISLRIGLPYWYRDQVTKQMVIVPGFIGEIVLGIIAACVLEGAAAATPAALAGATR